MHYDIFEKTFTTCHACNNWRKCESCEIDTKMIEQNSFMSHERLQHIIRCQRQEYDYLLKGTMFSL